jgi:hypothetical protein
MRMPQPLVMPLLLLSLASGSGSAGLGDDVATAEATVNPGADATATVTYVSGASAYFDAGSDDGVLDGAIVELVREGRVLGQLRVTYVSAGRASATPVGNIPLPVVGDLVRYLRREPEPAPKRATAETVDTRRSMRELGIRGRVGVRWLYVKDRTGRGGDFSQPSIDLRLTGTQVGGAPFDFNVDLRPRRTYRTLADGSSEDTSSNRIYQLHGAWRPGPFRLVLGRQSSPSVAPLSVFDGALFEYRVARFAVGGFVGTEPDPQSWDYSSDVRDTGVFFETGSAPGAATRWSLGGGAVSSTEESEINRDFLYVSGRLVSGRFSGYLLQQVDYNRGWREEAEDSTFTRSGTYLSLRWQASSSVNLYGGWDSRRSVRLYRDLETPVTEFDDEYREGYWGGAQWLGAGRWLVGANLRHSGGGGAGSADSYTLNLGALGLTRASLDLRLRATHYTGPLIEGDLAALSASFDAGRRARLEIHGGIRDERDSDFFSESETIGWAGLSGDLLLLRNLWATLSYDRTSGGEENNDQIYSSLSWRF